MSSASICAAICTTLKSPASVMMVAAFSEERGKNPFCSDSVTEGKDYVSACIRVQTRMHNIAAMFLFIWVYRNHLLHLEQVIQGF